MNRCARDVLRDELNRGRSPEVWIRFPRQLGDVIMTLPFLCSLQEDWNQVAAQCGTKLKWIAVGHDIGASLFQEAHPDFIHECHTEARSAGRKDPWKLLRLWRKQTPVAVINLSQSVRLGLAAWLSGVPIRAGDVDNHLHLLYHHRFTYRDLPIPVVRRFVPLLESLTGSALLRQPMLGPHNLGGRRAPELLKEAGWRGGAYITMSPGTRGFGKRWFPEEEKWPALARLVQSQGYEWVWLGGPDEKELGARLSALVPGSLDLTGRTSIPEVVAIQSGAYGNIAIDTGLAHTAAATGRPTVTIMGPTPEIHFSPQGPYAITVRGTETGPLPEEGWGSTSHHIQPARLLNLLHALAAEAQEDLARGASPESPSTPA